MLKTVYTVAENRALTADVYRMRLEGDTSAIAAPGQFVNIALDGLYLRRPISVCDWGGGWLDIVYKVVGRGTEKMSRLAPGAELDTLSGLGNGFDTRRCPDGTAVIGGGVGVPPMYGLAKRLRADGRRVIAVLGFNRKDEIFFEDEFRALGCETVVSTADGSAGVRGFVTDALKTVSFSFYCACGPEPMLRALYDSVPADGLLSFEERMGCGFGACMGCSCETRYGSKRICRDGPVLEKGEIIW